jgi:hypothetical protein
MTFACLVKRNSTALNTLVSFGDGFSVATGSFNNGTFTSRIAATAANNLYSSVSSTDSTPTLPVVNADGWVLLGVGKANGTSAPRFFRYVLSTATITRANGASSQADTTAANWRWRWVLGKDDFTNKFGGSMALAGVWGYFMSDAQFDGLYANLRTSDWQNASGGPPAALWPLNQNRTAELVPDLMGGGADQYAISGTTITVGDDPPGWTFDGQQLGTAKRPARMPLGV